jgi:hypothetical protein
MAAITVEASQGEWFYLKERSISVSGSPGLRARLHMAQTPRPRRSISPSSASATGCSTSPPDC